MTSKPRTIDDLGIDAYSRYARDQAIYDKTFSDESNVISKKAAIPVSKPNAPSEFEQHYSVQETASWAFFAPPTHALSFASSLFTYRMMPSLESADETEDHDPIQALEDALKRKRESKKDHSDEDIQQEESEKQIITQFLERVKEIDQSIELISSRRNQYQRG